MRIAFFAANLKVGGIQRALVSYMRLLSERQDIHADVFISDNRDAFFETTDSENIRLYTVGRLPYIIRLIPFDAARFIWGKRLSDMLKDAYGEELPLYDVAVDFDSYQQQCAMGALLAGAKRRVCWVHNDVEKKLASEWKYRVLHFFFKKKYALFDEMVMVGEGLIAPFYRVNPGAVKQHTVINNPIDTDEIKRLIGKGEPEAEEVMRHGDECIEIISVGRIFVQKGYDIMLDIIGDIAKVRSDKEIHFTILGDGPARNALEKRAEAMGIGSYLTFAGDKKNPFAYMEASDAYLSCSRYEGCPLTVLEAAALYLPVIMPAGLEIKALGIKGCEDIKGALLRVKKRRFDGQVRDMSGYNSAIVEKVIKLSKR